MKIALIKKFSLQYGVEIRKLNGFFVLPILSVFRKLFCFHDYKIKNI